MKDSKINWTRHTFNPWWGCTKVSAGCKHCYAEALSKRYGGDVWGPGKPRKRMSPEYWRQPLKWDRLEPEIPGVRDRVFCASMADVFDQEVPEEWRSDLWKLIPATANLDWLILSKRPELALRNAEFVRFCQEEGSPVWMGTSVEDQASCDQRIPFLADIPAPIRFLSAEPLLGPINLEGSSSIDWIIIGGESGPRARPMNIKWARDLMSQCMELGIACWVKQLGGIKDKRAELSDLPPDLQVRELPLKTFHQGA
jgi:protein gp37